MDRYYYLAAQLPCLTFGKKTYMNVSSFLKEAEKWLGRTDLHLLQKARMKDTAFEGKSPSIFRKYREFQFSLKTELASWRKSKRIKLEYKLSPALQKAVSGANPLQAEINLLKLEWDFLEEQEEGHYFDLDFLSLYFLKLQILERLFSFDKNKGQKVFDQLCEVEYGKDLW